MTRAGSQNRCNVVRHTNYKGTSLQTIQGTTVTNCCQQCSSLLACNVFVYCGLPKGCRNANINTIAYGQCDLKHQPGVKAGQAIQTWESGDNVDFTSGSVTVH